MFIYLDIQYLEDRTGGVKLSLSLSLSLSVLCGHGVVALTG